MYNNNKITKAVRLAIIFGASAIISAPALSADESVEGLEEVERIEVTGSRIKRADFEGATPVSVITAADIKMSGFDNIADVIRSSSFNTLGSYREKSGSSFGGASFVNLRGLGDERTAVLINGRRVPGSALVGTSAVDISTIPMAAVKSIEILTDSASAVYGADAIGGVINIIMKKDYNGTELEFNTEIPDRDGGGKKSFKLTTGTSDEKSSVMFSLEYNDKQAIADRHRSYSSLNFLSDAAVPTDGVDVTGANGGGNSGFAPDFSSSFSVGDCKESYYLPMNDPFGVPGTGCGYIYSDISYTTMDVERYSTFLTASRQLNDNHEVYFENRISKIKTADRNAPAIGGFFVGEDAPVNPAGEDFILYHRFVAHGSRDNAINATELDFVVGLQGNLAEDIGFDIDYDFSVRKYSYNAAEVGNNYVLQSNIEGLVADGSYDYTNPLSQDPKHLQAIANSKATLLRQLENETEAFQLNLSGDMPLELSGGSVQWAAGLEHFEEQYQDAYDSYREAQNVIGSAGNTASGGRERDAVYAEFFFPVMNDLEINLAVRYDDYSDFGSEVSPSISASYQVMDWVKVRASWGEGFKAPNLTDLYAKPFQSAEGVRDTTRCNAQGIDAADCPSIQENTFTAGNTQLKAETSESFNVGLIIDPIDNLMLIIDYYSVKLEQVVEKLEFVDVFSLEEKGTLPSGVVVNRAPTVDGIPGAITKCVSLKYPSCGIINPVANLASRTVEGLDLNIEYNYDTAYGVVSPKLSWSHILTYEDVLLTSVFDQPGTQGFPESRANLGINWEVSDFNINYAYQWISETDADSGGKFEAWSHHTINAIWTGYGGLEVSLGVRNFTDEDPSIDTVNGWNADTSSTSMDLYSIDGRVYTAGLKLTF